jgi:hypothetical protein
LRLNQKALATLNKLNPSVAGPISSMLAEDNTSVVAQVHELAPSPERKIFAVAFLPFFEIVWRLPIVVFIEKLFIGNGIYTRLRICGFLRLNGSGWQAVDLHNDRGET